MKEKKVQRSVTISPRVAELIDRHEGYTKKSEYIEAAILKYHDGELTDADLKKIEKVVEQALIKNRERESP